MRQQLRNLPSVDRLAEAPEVVAAAPSASREWRTALARQELEAARRRIIQAGQSGPGESEGDDGAAAAVSFEALVAGVGRRIADASRPSPRRVINATGVALHTNLGRAPLSRAAMQAAAEAALGYSDLEFDLDTGRRGSRQAAAQTLLTELTGAEAALVVNNNASALLLGLSALAAGGEVVVSRAEAVEIGGGFRVPEVLRQSGAALVDVGTTNRTYRRDYEQAAAAATAAFLKVHASNFRVQGFTVEVPAAELAELADRLGIAALHDVGSGSLLPTERYGLAHEPMPQESVRAGMGLVFFSGDKLLGGPQAGIIVGRRELVERLARHPLARAVRIDKLSLAALTATLAHYRRGEAEREIPVWRMLSATPAEIRQRAQGWQAALEQDDGEKENGASRYRCFVEPSRSAIGGGSLPGETLPTFVLAVAPGEGGISADELLRRLRQQPTPVIARIEDGRALLDPRTVAPEEDPELLAALRNALA